MPGSAAPVGGGSRKGDLGQTRPAPVREQPGPGQPAQRTPARRQRGHHPGARARRPRGRGALPAGAGLAVRPHQVPGRRAPGPRGAGPDQGRRPSSPSRRRPTSSSGSTAWPPSWPRPRPATPRCSRCSPRTPTVSDAAKELRREMIASAGMELEEEEEPEPDDAELLARRRPPGGPAVRRPAPALQPVPRPRLLRRRRAPAQGAPAGDLGAARPALPLLRVRRRRGLHAAPGAARHPAARRASS